ncbi:adenylosuccinate lyase [Lewinella cohaerens]|uniref:adenylosuccinate lyase n=1 Tax=Lewinella cohaerens TaxID=70995 RepID=UPI0003823DBE|nr:adenylosuccinate lyase [Lewinella cohaerens]
MTSLEAVSPIDGRYRNKTQNLSEYFSEAALIRYRVLVEVKYFQALHELGLPQLKGIAADKVASLSQLHEKFSSADAASIKEIEKTTNHDVKAVEYHIKAAFEKAGLSDYQEFVHFGLTSQDINNTAVPLSLQDAYRNVFLPGANAVLSDLNALAEEWKAIPMLARTHGQPASPTLLGKEIAVFTARMEHQLEQLANIELRVKFGGATGNLNAHYAAYPEYDWHTFAENFAENSLGLKRAYPTTQIEHYDNLAAFFHAMVRINTILIDFCRDIWTYISMEYFRQRTIAGEVGSSAMPHKVNPIDFENAEGNLGIANALLEHLAHKLPVSRLQRDLTDSTVLRNVGMPFAHTMIAFQAIQKGLSKLLLNEAKLHADLESNWIVIAEAIQNILRRENYPKPYEALKALTRGKAAVGEAEIKAFIKELPVSDEIRQELLLLSPHTYTGRFV